MTVAHIDGALRKRREDVLRAHLEAERAGDTDAILATFAHPRYELVGGSGRVYDGAEDVSRYLRDRRAAFPDLRTELIDLHHSDRDVIAELWLLGTHQGALGELDATGRAFRCRTACFFAFDGDDLVGIRVYFDLGSIVRQLAGG
jgi:steroid delta-isomerase-like uncharacterized protein